MSNQGDDDVETIHLRQASSGRVDYSDEVLLHESSTTRVVFVPFYVARTAGRELSIKIKTYKKRAPPMNWALVDDKSLSMKEPAARRLLAALRTHLAVTESASDNGTYVVIPLHDGRADLSGHDPATVAAALARVLGQEDVVAHLAGLDLSAELIGAVRGAIRLREMSEAVARLRTLLDSNEASEQVYQGWCEQHSWALGQAYVMRDDVRNISASDNIDLLLPTVISGFRDIVELKRPDAKVLLWDSGHKNYCFSSGATKAIGQCHRYLDVLNEVARQGLRDRPEVVAYHPRAIIVIGRSHDWSPDQQRALHGLNARLAGIMLMTYDHLLNQGERLVQMLSAQSADADDASNDDYDPDTDF